MMSKRHLEEQNLMVLKHLFLSLIFLALIATTQAKTMTNRENDCDFEKFNTQLTILEDFNIFVNILMLHSEILAS